MYSFSTDPPGTQPQLPVSISHSSSIMIQVHDFFNMGTTDMGDMGFTMTPMGDAGGMQTVRYSTGWRAPEQDRKPSPKIARIQSQNYEEIKKQCLDQGALWEDPSFPAVNASVFHSYNLPYQFEWKRPSELCDDPQMFVGGATRFDVVQGELGNCWFLAAVGSLCATKSKELLHRVIPLDNSFAKQQYAGVFHFKIWQYGKWMDVVVDDRLPTLNGRLQYLHSPSNNEFWAALLEKAYAKLCASYEALSGGCSSEAMEDFTGGIVEHYELTKKIPDDLFHTMKKCYERQSLLCCSIDTAGMALESELSTGLVVGHAYSITAVKLVKVRGHDVQLVRIRNPWGNKVEWNGAWSDKSSEWNMLGEKERQELGLSFEDDGEFWMAYQDFTRNFHKLELCLLTPGTLSEERGRRWELTAEDGSWKKRVNAGGCRNFLDSFWTNPQYRIRVADRDDDSDKFGTIIVAIMQKERRKKKKEGVDLLTIGYSLYKVPEEDTGPLDLNFFKYNASAAKCPTFTNLREVSGRHSLEPGYYVLVPCTFQPHEEGDFLLRVFSEKKVTSGEVDEPTGLVGVKSETLEPIPQNVIGLNDAESLGKLIVTQDDADKENEIRVLFKKISGADKEVDAYELQDILNSHFKQELAFGGFSLETTRSMVAMMDSDRSGKLGYSEFKKLWVDLRQWKKVFKEFDRDSNGSFSSHELREALNSAGFTVANATFAALVMRYSDPQGRITFDEYILCAVKIKTMFAIYLQMKGSKPTAAFTLDQFIQTTMYA